jgi:hypothetical protein
LVSGRSAPVDAEGKFKVPIVLGEGKHTIDVKAVGVGNQNAESKHAYEIDTRVKATTVKVPWKK